MIKVLVVDDSLTHQELITHVLNSDPDIEVIDTAMDGKEAIQKVKTKKPDIVSMDIHMPNKNGVEATREIMSLNPLPIIIVTSSVTPNLNKEAFEALDAGALAVIDKSNCFKDKGKELIEAIKTMSEVKVVRRYQHLERKVPKKTLNPKSNNIELIAIGASTGGPNILLEIFSKLQKPFPPILVVQHISPSFLEGFVDWLKSSTGQDILIAENNEIISENAIYLAPSECQMGLKEHGKILVTRAELENGHRPSVSFLFKSVAKVMRKNAMGILLTGMGRDGAEGLKLMKESGAITIAQDEASSIIYGMPKEAAEMNAADFILNPLEIIHHINEIYHEKSKPF